MDESRLAKFRAGKSKSQGGYNLNEMKDILERLGKITCQQSKGYYNKASLLRVYDGGANPVIAEPVVAIKKIKARVKQPVIAEPVVVIKKIKARTRVSALKQAVLAELKARRKPQERNEQDVATHMLKQEDVMSQLKDRAKFVGLQRAGTEEQAKRQLKKADQTNARRKPRERNEQDVATHMLKQEDVMSQLKARAKFVNLPRAGSKSKSSKR